MQMKRRSAIALVSVCTFGATLAKLSGQGTPGNKMPISAQHAGQSVHSAPRHMMVEFENDAVQVLRIRIDPHEKTPMHEASARVVVYLTEDHSLLIFPDGRTQQQSHAAGEVKWFEAQRHAGENLGDKPIEFVAVIPKEKPPHGHLPNIDPP
jgi:quercetin dioxygenase-like cupin family protein